MVGGGGGMDVDTAAIRAAAKLLAEAAEKIRGSQEALQALANAPHFSFGAHFNTDSPRFDAGFPGADPAITWAAVEETIDRIRFGSTGLIALQHETVELTHRLREAAEAYEEHERRIAHYFDLGKLLGKDLHEAGLARIGQLTPAPSVQIALNITQGNQGFVIALLSGEWGGAIRNGMKAGMPIASYLASQVFRRQNDGVAVGVGAFADLAAIIRGEVPLGQDYTSEEAAALIYGFVEGAQEFGASRVPIGLALAFNPALATWTRSMQKTFEARIYEEYFREIQGVTITKVEQSPLPESTRDIAGIAEKVGERYSGNEDASQIAIEVLTHLDGRQSAIIYLPGMNTATAHDKQPNDGIANIWAIQGQETEQLIAAKQALMQLDLPPETELVIGGHSKGGMDAMNLAADPEMQRHFNVVGVNTFGTPATGLKLDGARVAGTFQREFETETQVLNISHHEDLVPGLGMVPFAGTPNQTEVRSNAAVVLPDDVDLNLTTAHDIATYEETAARISKTMNPSVVRWQQSAGTALGQPGSASTLHVYEVEKVPRSRNKQPKSTQNRARS